MSLRYETWIVVLAQNERYVSLKSNFGDVLMPLNLEATHDKSEKKNFYTLVPCYTVSRRCGTYVEVVTSSSGLFKIM